VTSADDATVLAVLAAVANLTTYDGHVEDSNPDTKVISAALPYVVFYGQSDDGSPGDSLAGPSGAHLSGFQLTGVGETREQARWALEQARAVLDRKRVTFAAGSRLVRATDDQQYVRRDDTWTRPGGAPLFFGVDRYAVLI
jgi:phage gp37-like protein